MADEGVGHYEKMVDRYKNGATEQIFLKNNCVLPFFAL